MSKTQGSMTPSNESFSHFEAKKLRQKSRQWRQNNCLRTQWRGGVIVRANGVSAIEMPFECEAIVLIRNMRLCRWLTPSPKTDPNWITMTMHILVWKCSIWGRFVRTIDNIVLCNPIRLCVGSLLAIFTQEYQDK